MQYLKTVFQFNQEEVHIVDQQSIVKANFLLLNGNENIRELHSERTHFTGITTLLIIKHLNNESLSSFQKLHLTHFFLSLFFSFAPAVWVGTPEQYEIMVVLFGLLDLILILIFLFYH